tara:strand:- start:342 stop:605 length:264 start_codon:yes stop_codon:yes gene_type:complete
MYHLKFLFFLIISLSCNTQGDNIDCIECGGGMLDGFLYKDVNLADLTNNLNEVNASASLGDCIRFKMDGSNFSSAEIVDDCCCNLYN